MSDNILSYVVSRDKIESGDFLLFKKHHLAPSPTMIQSLVSLATKSDYYHSAVAVWLHSPNGLGRLFAIEADPRVGRRVVPISSLKGCIEVIRPAKMDWSSIDSFVIDKVDKEDYSFIDAFGVWTRLSLNISIPNSHGEICSEFNCKILKKLGYDVPDKILSPGELSELMINSLNESVLFTILKES
jgi:hypothetical protein